jgi:CTP-dependent riboflavin kinase
MKKFSLLVLLLSLCTAALAQVGTELPLSQDQQAQRELRRVELRNALQIQAQTQTQGSTQEARETRRQLTAQEKEALRQQLRQPTNLRFKPQS